MAVFNSNKWLGILNKNQALHREMMENSESFRQINADFHRSTWGIERIVQGPHLAEIFAADKKLDAKKFAIHIERIRSHWDEESQQRLGSKPEDLVLRRLLLKMYEAWLVVVVARDKCEACCEIYQAHGESFNRLNEVATRHHKGHNPEWNVAADTAPNWS